MFLINVNLNTGLLSLTEQKKENMMCSSGSIRNNLIAAQNMASLK